MLKSLLFLLILCAAVLGSGDITKRIIGGSPVVNGQFPDITWQVGLIIQGVSLCGGAILDPMHILTAAHCVRNINTNQVVSPASVSVRPGITLNNFQGIVGTMIWVHPSYANGIQPASMVDLAVIKLNQPIVFSPLISAIALPRTVDVSPPPGDYIVSGYGTTSSTAQGSSGTVSNLLYVDVPYVPFGTCQATAPFTLPTTALCAGGVAGKDSCQGDSGGPLVANIGTMQSPNWVLAGIVSTGTRVTNPLCAVADEFGVYVDVKPHIPFIDGILGSTPPPPSASGSTIAVSLVLVVAAAILSVA